MGVACGMEHTGAHVCHMGDDIDHLKRVHKLDGSLAVAFQSECHHSATSVGQVFFGKGITLVVSQSGIVNPCHTRVVVQELRHLLGIAAMTLHAQCQGLKSEIEQERVLRCRYRTEVAHKLGNKLGGISHLAECLGVGESVV